MSDEGHPPTVLVVDDVVLVRMLIAETLRHRGFRVLEAGSGEEAVRLLEASTPAVDAILTDIYMPGAAMDGLQLVKWVTINRPGLRVVLGSGVTADLELGEMTAAVGPIVPKPYDYNEIEFRLRGGRGNGSGGSGPKGSANGGASRAA
jgi:CheY-like chemotaxis protein